MQDSHLRETEKTLVAYPINVSNPLPYICLYGIDSGWSGWQQLVSLQQVQNMLSAYQLRSV